ncbi:MAG: NAD(P)/FAD-dependent oxidoreductase [Candidatus Dormibacterales bacterium]
MIAILGGGVAGASLAWALARAGHRQVTVFDPRPCGAGSTGRALGGFRTQHGSLLNTQLALASRPFYAELGERVAFRATGYLYLAEDDGVARDLAQRAETQRAWGIPVEHPEPRSVAPFLEVEDVRGANFCRLDGVYLPALVLDAFVEKAREGGVRLRYGEEASPGALEAAEAVVVASGAWSQGVGGSLGVDLPVTPWERGVYQVGPFDWLNGAEPMVLEAGSGFHFREREGRLLVMFPQADGEGPHQWDRVRAWLARRVPKAAVGSFEAHWTGAYEMTPDHHPLVGATGRPGVWASCGFSGHGIMQAPAVAASLAAMILGLTPPLDISALDPRRRVALVDSTQL